MTQHLKLFVRLALIGLTVFFLGKTLLANWQDVKTLELQSQAWLFGTAALGIAIAAQVWIAFVWGWILETLQNPVSSRWSILTFLTNTPAKYIPGNFWHMVGRFKAAKDEGLSLESVALSVLLEPMLIVGGALLLALLNTSYPSFKGLGLGLILIGLHPWGINKLWRGYRKFQGKDTSAIGMQHYPLRELVGATGFMLLRSLTFLCALWIFTPIPVNLLRPMVGGFSLAWILSLITPVPAGIGVFEASAVAMLDGYLSPAVLLAAVAMYRLVSILAEAIGAGGAFLLKDAQRKSAA
jgi:glycosyltransferase 2 family protein